MQRARYEWAGADRPPGIRLMYETSLFDLYRHVLVLLVIGYTTVRLSQFVWTALDVYRHAGAREQLVHRYLVVNLLRVRARRFRRDLIETGLLLVVFLTLVVLHGYV
jgi:hypothetical protein